MNIFLNLLNFNPLLIRIMKNVKIKFFEIFENIENKIQRNHTNSTF